MINILTFIDTFDEDKNKEIRCA